VTVSHRHVLPALMLLRTLSQRTTASIVIVGNVDDADRERLCAFDVTYIDEREIDLRGRMPSVSWDHKHRDVGWYRQMFVRLSIDRFMEADHVVILDSEVFVFDNWDESRLYDDRARLKNFHWVPAQRKSDWDYMMYRGSGYVIQHLEGCRDAMAYASSTEFRRHISGVVLFSRANVAHLWRRLERECDLQAVMHQLFENEPDLTFSDHDLYGIAVDLGVFDDVDPPAPVAELLGWYDRHDDPVFHQFREAAMWSMCQAYEDYATPDAYLGYATSIARSLGCRLPEIPYWNPGDRPLIDHARRARDDLSYFDAYERQLDHTFRQRFITMRHALELISDVPEPLVVEIGTLRDDNVGGGHSTFKFGEFCSRTGGLLHSVDISAEAIEFSRRATANYLPWIHHHVSDSTDFLSTFGDEIDLLYLDGFDSTAGQEGPAARKQLAEIEAALPRLSERAVVLLDDADLPDEGKTQLSSRFLRSHGFEMVEDRYQRLFRRTESNGNDQALQKPTTRSRVRARAVRLIRRVPPLHRALIRIRNRGAG
jgi:hypothetical protein